MSICETDVTGLEIQPLSGSGPRRRSSVLYCLLHVHVLNIVHKSPIPAAVAAAAAAAARLVDMQQACSMTSIHNDVVTRALAI